MRPSAWQAAWIYGDCALRPVNAARWRRRAGMIRLARITVFHVKRSGGPAIDAEACRPLRLEGLVVLHDSMASPTARGLRCRPTTGSL